MQNKQMSQLLIWNIVNNVHEKKNQQLAHYKFPTLPVVLQMFPALVIFVGQ